MFNSNKDDKLVIFGGLNSDNFLGSHLFILQLNFSKIPDNNLEKLNYNIQILDHKNPVLIEDYRRLKSKMRRISIVEEFKLPNIKEFLYESPFKRSTIFNSGNEEIKKISNLQIFK